MPKRTDIPEKDYGEPIKYDPTFNGPLYKRSCTDIICLFLFLIFLVVWGGVSWYALTQGDVRRILAPTDSNGHKCGLDSHVADKPYLVFFDIRKCINLGVTVTGCPTKQVCVKTCPTEYLFREVLNLPPRPHIDTLRDKVICTIDPKDITSIEHLFTLMDENICAENVFKSDSVLRRCFGDLKDFSCNLEKNTMNKNPKNKQTNKCIFNFLSNNNHDSDKHLNNLEKTQSRDRVLDTYIGIAIGGFLQYFTEDASIQEMGNNVIEDIVNSRWAILIALIIVMVICFIYIALMRWIAGPLVWFSIIGAIGGLSYSIYLCYNRYAILKDNQDVIHPPNTNLNNIGKSILSLRETWLVFLILASVFLVIIVLSVIFLRKRIIIAIALIKEGSKAVSSIKSTVFFPIFPWVFQCLFLALAIVVGLYLYTIGDPNYKAYKNDINATCPETCNYTMGSECTPETFNKQCLGCAEAFCHFVGITNYPLVTWFIVMDVFGFFWVIFFLDGFGQMVLASTFATWYWTFKKSDVPFFTLTAGILRTMRYNLGTIAFGSLIITICRMIRLCLEYIDHKLKKFDNAFTRAILCCMKCFFKCLESFLKFINRNAYIMCAVHGKAFLPSARDAFSLLMRNILRVFVLDKVTDFLFFLSKLVVAIGCGVGAYFAFTSPELYKATGQETLHYDLAPPIIIGIAAYLIGSVFFSVYSMAVDTLFLCFLEDCERNDGSEQKPYFMSTQLKKILGKKNKSN